MAKQKPDRYKLNEDGTIDNGTYSFRIEIKPPIGIDPEEFRKQIMHQFGDQIIHEEDAEFEIIKDEPKQLQ